MKQKLLLKSMLLLFALIAGSSSVWADNEVTFSYADYKGQGTSSTGSEYTMTKTDVSITETKFYCGSSATYAQLYAEGTLTITPSTGVTIKQIDITTTSTSYNGYQSSGTVTASTGSCSADGTKVTWTGTATSAFTISHNKQIRWTSIVVTYTGGQTPTCATPTFNIAAGPVLSGTTIALSTATTSAAIHYTTDGSTPTSSSTTYTSAIAIDAAKTIKAIAVRDGYNNSEVASASYTILAAPSPNATNVGSNYYTLVEDANDLANGDAILIVSGTSAMSTTQNANNRGSADVTIANSAIDNPGATVQKLVLVKSGDYYFFYTGDAGYLYAASSSSNYLRTETTADQNAAATISINASKEATIIFKGANTRNYMRFNTPNFACYATGSTTGAAVQIYKEVVKPADAKSAAEFSFPKANYYNAKGEQVFTAPTLSTAAGYDGTVNYTSSVTSVAEVNSSTGAVTIKAVGTTVITASADATSNFYEDQASYTLKVYEIEDGVFDFSKGDYTSGAAPGTANNLTTESQWVAGNVTMDVAGRNIWYNANDLRLYANNAGEGNPSNAGNLTFTVPTGYVIYKITGLSGTLTPSEGDAGSTWQGTPAKTISFTHNGGGTVTLNTVSVYYTTPTVSVTTTGEYTAFCSYPQLDFTGTGLTVYTAKVNTTTGKVTLTAVEGNIAPASKGVILKGSATTVDVPLAATSPSVSNNDLKPVFNDSQVNWQVGDDPNYKYNYILQNGAFYKATGAKLRAGKAYLQTTYDVTSAGAPCLTIEIEGETTGINEVNGSESKVNGEYYNLAGQRVANPTKGLYIVNGKKVIIK